MKTRRLAFAAALTASVAVACQVLIGIKDENGGPPDPDAATAETGPADGGADVKRPGNGACVGSLPENRARLAEAGFPDAEADVPYFFATRTFVFRPLDGRVIGFNLDGLCTGINGPVEGTSTCTSPVEAGLVDVDGGVDNAFGRAFKDLAATGDLGASSLASNVSKGYFTVILQLTNWSGNADDGEVNVEVLTGGELLCDTCDGGSRPTAKWDGTDEWMIRGRQAKGFPADGKPNIAPNSFLGKVKNGVLTVIPNRVLSFAIAGSTFELLPSMIYAELTTIEGQLGLANGVIAGVARASDLLSFGGRIVLEGTPVCKDPFSKGLLFEKVCASRDSLRDEKVGQRCNAVSFAFEFTALPVRITTTEAPPADDDCRDAGFDATCP